MLPLAWWWGIATNGNILTDPSQVGRQTGSFSAAFVEHEKSFNEEIERVNGWRIALKEVADLAGMVLGDG